MTLSRVSVFSAFRAVAFAAVLLTPLVAAPTRVACVGDSITAGSGTRVREVESYPAQLQRMLKPEEWLVKNFGVGGATLMNHADKPYQKQSAFADALAFLPDIVVIKLGTNDTKPQNWRLKEEFVADYRDLIGKFRALASHPRIFVCHPIVVVGEGNFGINTPALQEELPLIDTVVASEHVQLIDLQPVLADRADLIPDRIHPNAEGANRIARAVYHALTGHDFTGELAPAEPAQPAPVTQKASAVEDARPVVDDSKVAPEPVVNPALPTLFVVGDSTAKSDVPLRGWGSEIGAYFDSTKINVVNRAIGGRSTRTFLTDGRWDKILAELKPGDFVLVQFGHNDDGDYRDPKAKGRPSIRGDGEETAEAIKADLKTMETIHSFGWYLRKYATDTRAHGATPILLTKVPHKDWKDGKIVREHDVATFIPWTQNAARATGALYLDVNAIIAAGFERLGAEKVEPFFGDLRTHSTPAGAKYNAAAVVAGLKTLQPNPLERYFSSLANDLPPSLR